jgi:hypothetical protein
MMSRASFLLCAALVSACGSADNETVDANVVIDSAVLNDANVAVDSAIAVDAAAPADADTLIDAATLADALVSVDAAMEAAVDAARVDAAVDASAADSGPLPTTRAGQCFANAHCASGTCVATAPGGFCECSGGSCGEGPADECTFGSCLETCSTTSDCSPGLRCNTSAGVCALRSCSSSGTCGDYHSCEDGFCRRTPCSAGACPAGTTCRSTSDGMLCVEDYLTFE